MNDNFNIPVPVLDNPHWRVVFRPSTFENSRIQSISRLKELVEQNQVRLRGWDFPHMGGSEERGTGNNWIASWSTFRSHIEYWRFFQSTQFVYLSSVREKTEQEWDTKLRREFHSRQLNEEQIDAIPGFFSLTNFIYTITEYFEFASRLCQASIYSEPIEITIELKKIRNFTLTASWDRALYELYQATEDDLGNSWSFEPTELIAASNEASLETIVWFLERFGWVGMKTEVLRKDQENFLGGRL